LYFHRPATRQNSTDHRGTIRTFVPLSTASPRQDGNKFALHPLIRIFPKYSNAATLKKNLAPPAGCTIFAEDRKRFGNLCVQTRTIALIFILSLIVLDRMRRKTGNKFPFSFGFSYLCKRQNTARTHPNNRQPKRMQKALADSATQEGGKLKGKFGLPLTFHYLCNIV